MSVNKVILIGNLGQDPEVRYLGDGAAVANMSVATSESWKDKQTGEKKDRTEWHRVVCYRKTAEFVGKYLTKGRTVYIEGKLQTRSWDKDGQKHYSTEIVANEIQPIGKGEQAREKYPEPPAPGGTESDDIPF